MHTKIVYKQDMKERICIIEDDQDLLEAMSMSLEAEDYTIIGATKSSNIKSELLGDNNVDLFIIDIFLASENGKDICLSIKNNPKTKNVPVLLISATHDLEKQAQFAKADDFLSKPFEIDNLFNKINAMLRIIIN